MNVPTHTQAFPSYTAAVIRTLRGRMSIVSGREWVVREVCACVETALRGGARPRASTTAATSRSDLLPGRAKTFDDVRRDVVDAIAYNGPGAPAFRVRVGDKSELGSRIYWRILNAAVDEAICAAAGEDQSAFWAAVHAREAERRRGIS